jgi:hypothetical protein
MSMLLGTGDARSRSASDSRYDGMGVFGTQE